MAAGLQGSKDTEFEVAGIYAFMQRLSKSDADAVRQRVGSLIAYVRGLRDGEATLLTQIVEHAAEARMHA